MSIPDVREAYTGRINAVTIGATKEEGGTRSRAVTVGGHTTIPFLAFEGGHPPWYAAGCKHSGFHGQGKLAHPTCVGPGP